MFDRIEEVEIEVEHKLNGINVAPMKSLNINELEVEVINGSVGVKPDIKPLIEEKVKYYVDEQTAYFDDIKKDFISLGYSYVSELNDKHIEEIENDIITEYSKTITNHQTLIDYALNELEKIQTVERESVKAATDINTEN